MNKDKEFVPYQQSLDMKELGFDGECFGYYNGQGNYIREEGKLNSNCSKPGMNSRYCTAPTFSQAINFLYICSNKKIDIELKGSDTHEERVKKIEQGCKDLWNLQNNKSN
tara:strand:+ start:221 stop:550 length:330 start_codon:yes stop_codon:yes gene_type:complete